MGKLYGRVLIKRVRVGTDCAMEEEQCGFRQGRGCMDQVFAVRQVRKKYLVNVKYVFWAWQMLRVHGVGGKVMKAVQIFYVYSIGCLSGWEMM